MKSAKKVAIGNQITFSSSFFWRIWFSKYRWKEPVQAAPMDLAKVGIFVGGKVRKVQFWQPS